MPKEVYLSSLDGSRRRERPAAPLRAAIKSPAIELKGCTKSQPAVADLMSRMRNVQGVTRVALGKSDKDTGAAATAAPTVNPCGKGATPSFEMVIFFERSTVAAALSGATGAVDPAAAATARSGQRRHRPAAGRTSASHAVQTRRPRRPPEATP